MLLSLRFYAVVGSCLVAYPCLLVCLNIGLVYCSCDTAGLGKMILGLDFRLRQPVPDKKNSMRGRYFRKQTNKTHAAFVCFVCFLAKYQLEPRTSYRRRPRRARQGVRASH
jgi:hypothetical protein